MGLVRYCGEEESEEEEARRREIMEWENRQKQQQVEEEELQVVAAVHNNGQVVPYVKVMTDDQMELLRKQIAAYATICDQLVHLHKSITSQQDLTGMKVGNFYCDSLMTSTGHKISSRQRWTPTAVQLQILEHIFDQGNGTPSKQKIKEITNELMQHGQISETNVYNWFQNRRARSKRKQLVTTTKNAEPEVEMEDEPQTENKAKSESIQPHQNPAARPEDLGFSEMNGNLHYMESYSSKADSMFCSDSGSKSNSSLGHLSFYETVLSTPSIDQLMGKTEIPGSFNPFRPEEGYDMI